jgi:hypothetical protein
MLRRSGAAVCYSPVSAVRERLWPASLGVARVSFLIDMIPEASLDTWNRWLYYLTIGLPVAGALFGAICGIAFFQISNRIADVQKAAADLRVSQANDRANSAFDQAKAANERARAANESLGYIDVATLNFLGLHGNTQPPLEEHTQLNNLLAPHVQADPFVWQCSPEAFAAYDAAIGLNAKFPFSYYYRGTCKKSVQAQWQEDIDTARRIFLITTRIAGRHPSHGQFLTKIETGELGKPP